MLFNSYVFLFGFLPPVLVGTWALRHKNLRLLFLTMASWAFYAWWDWRFLPLMLSTTMVDYVAALMIHRTDDRAPPQPLADRLARGQPRAARLFQVRRLLPQLAERDREGARRFARAARPPHPPADRDQLLHVQLDVVHDRRLAEACRADEAHPRVHDVRRALPAPHRRADRPVRRPPAAAARAAAETHLGRGRRRRVLLRVRACEEAPDRGSALAARRRALCELEAPRLRRLVGGGDRLRAPALFRLLRLLRHGGRSRVAARVPVPTELQLAVQGGERLGLLAALAHEPVRLVPGLPVHPARRLAARRETNGHQPRDHDVPRRPVARRGVDVRRLGTRSRRGARDPWSPEELRADARRAWSSTAC